MIRILTPRHFRRWGELYAHTRKKKKTKNLENVRNVQSYEFNSEKSQQLL